MVAKIVKTIIILNWEIVAFCMQTHNFLYQKSKQIGGINEKHVLQIPASGMYP